VIGVAGLCSHVLPSDLAFLVCCEDRSPCTSVNLFTDDIYLGIMLISHLSTQCLSPSSLLPARFFFAPVLSLLSDTRPFLSFFVTKPMTHVIVAALLLSSPPRCHCPPAVIALLLSSPSRCHCPPAVIALPLSLPSHCRRPPAVVAPPPPAVVATPLAPSITCTLLALRGDLPRRHNRARLPGMWDLWEQHGR